MPSLRSEEMTGRYNEMRKTRISGAPCMLCGKAPLKEFKYWKVTTNDFPYDKVAEVHHMLLPLRHVDEIGLTDEESRELIEIKESYVNSNYDFIFEAASKNKSIPEHFHVHLIVIKGELR